MTVEDMFEEFRAVVIPRVSGIQMREMRKAFLAGAGRMAVWFTEEMPEDEARACERISAIQAEIKQYFAPGGGVYDDSRKN